MTRPGPGAGAAGGETLLGRVLWLDRDGAGAERCTIVRHAAGYRLSGLVLREHDRAPIEIRYRISADASRRVVGVVVDAETPTGTLSADLRADGVAHWSQEGVRLAWLDGCRDVHCDFSPAAHMLTVARLALAVGEVQEVRTVCLRYPFLDAEGAVFRYERLDEQRVALTGPKVETVLRVDDQGLLVDYEGGWVEIARA